MAAPTYISEIALAKRRGRLVIYINRDCTVFWGPYIELGGGREPDASSAMDAGLESVPALSIDFVLEFQKVSLVNGLQKRSSGCERVFGFALSIGGG